LPKVLDRRGKTAAKGVAGLRAEELALLTVLKHLQHKEPAKRRAA
jgi:hypothetical protein